MDGPAWYRYRGEILLVVLSTAIGSVLAFSLDRAVGILHPPAPEPIVFQPNVSVQHKTVEFEYTAAINRHGFRGANVAREHPGVFRIVAFGDSYTYGWGVELEDSWPKVLEGLLRKSGYPVEVLNLGSPGSTTNRYAEEAERAMEQLLPDLLLVAILQTDDLNQLKGAKSDFKPDALRTLVRSWFPALSRLTVEVRSISLFDPPQLTAAVSKDSVQSIIDGWGPAQRERYERLDHEVKALFRAGEINPALFSYVINQPDFYVSPLDERQRTELAGAIEAMAGHLTEIQEAARTHGAQLIAISLPDGPYVDQRALHAVGRLGFLAPEMLLATKVPADDIAAAARRAGVDLIDLTDAMRARRPGEPAYYAFDCHPNPVGHRNFAEVLQRALVERGAIRNTR